MAEVSPVITFLLILVFLGCSMVLLSSTIAWLSVEFSGPIPHTLGFVLGIFSLINSILAIMMIGITNLRKMLGFVFMVSSATTLLASIALFVLWVMEYVEFCNTCSEPEQTMSCVDLCDDECCFKDTSQPLAILFVIFSALVLVSSLVGVIVAIPYIRYSSNTDRNSVKKR